MKYDPKTEIVFYYLEPKNKMLLRHFLIKHGCYTINSAVNICDYCGLDAFSRTIPNFLYIPKFVEEKTGEHIAPKLFIALKGSKRKFVKVFNELLGKQEVFVDVPEKDLKVTLQMLSEDIIVEIERPTQKL